MLFFDYLFFRVSQYYSRWSDDTNHVYGILFVSIIQVCLLGLISLVLSIFSQVLNDILFEQNENKNYLESPVSLIALCILALNYWRYTKVKSYKQLSRKWNSEIRSLRSVRKLQLIAISIIIIGLTFFLSIYRINNT